MNSLGNGLSILILCDYTPHHNWMTFLCWYSLSVNLPDAKIFISCNRTLKYQHFNWVYKCKIPFMLHKPMEISDRIEYSIKDKKIDFPLLIIPADVVCIREIPELLDERIYLENQKELCGDCKDENLYPFVTYRGGWGNFNVDSWINTYDCPFLTNLKYTSFDMNANEIKIGQIWQKAAELYKGVK